MKRKNLTLIFNHFEFDEVHLAKDVFLIPYYLGKKLNYDVSVVYPRTETNQALPKYWNGVNLIPLTYINTSLNILKSIRFYLYLILNAKKIDMLVRFHLSSHTKILAIIYKILNKKGKVYVKLDINIDDLEKISVVPTRKKIMPYLNRLFSMKFIKIVDYISCETTDVFHWLNNTKIPSLQFKEKLKLLPNSFDEELLESYKIKIKEFHQKKNIILTVGRLGAAEKNTEMLLTALENVRLNTWEVYLIGNVEPRIEKIIKKFYENNPDKFESVKFLGQIRDRRQLWQLYNDAKCFVLTSNWEGYPMVYTEAKRFRNYIISTNVSACKDITENGKYGICSPIGNQEILANILNEIIGGKIDIDVYSQYDFKKISWENRINNLDIK